MAGVGGPQGSLCSADLQVGRVTFEQKICRRKADATKQSAGKSARDTRTVMSDCATKTLPASLRGLGIKEAGVTEK
jgi:hypothetical protein